MGKPNANGSPLNALFFGGVPVIQRVAENPAIAHCKLLIANC